MFEFQLKYADDCRKTLAIPDFSNEKDTKTSSEISLSTLDSRMILSISRENLQIRWTKRIIQRFFFFCSGQKLPWNGISIEVTLKIDFIARDCRIDESSYISIESSITHARNRMRISRQHSYTNRRCRKLITVPGCDVVKNTGGELWRFNRKSFHHPPPSRHTFSIRRIHSSTRYAIKSIEQFDISLNPLFKGFSIGEKIGARRGA